MQIGKDFIRESFPICIFFEYASIMPQFYGYFVGTTRVELIYKELKEKRGWGHENFSS